MKSFLVRTRESGGMSAKIFSPPTLKQQTRFKIGDDVKEAFDTKAQGDCILPPQVYSQSMLLISPRTEVSGMLNLPPQTRVGNYGMPNWPEAEVFFFLHCDYIFDTLKERHWHRFHEKLSAVGSWTMYGSSKRHVCKFISRHYKSRLRICINSKYHYPKNL